MKPVLKFLLKYYLKYLTKLVLLIHRPVIIAVAGSINKTFAKEVIAATLKNKGLSVRSNPKNFNTEIGLPLAILYLKSGYNSYRQWLPIIRQSLSILGQKNFPGYLILELGTSDPGDMAYLLSIIKPSIVVITDITQRYLESFSDMDSLVKEYEYLVKKISATGLLIINSDNSRIKKLTDQTKARVITYGFDAKADYKIISATKNNLAMTIEWQHDQHVERLTLEKFGRHHIYAYLIGRIIDHYVPISKTEN